MFLVRGIFLSAVMMILTKRRCDPPYLSQVAFGKAVCASRGAAGSIRGRNRERSGGRNVVSGIKSVVFFRFPEDGYGNGKHI